MCPHGDVCQMTDELVSVDGGCIPADTRKNRLCDRSVHLYSTGTQQKFLTLPSIVVWSVCVTEVLDGSFIYMYYTGIVKGFTVRSTASSMSSLVYTLSDFIHGVTTRVLRDSAARDRIGTHFHV